jgi:hypothetical protein
MAIRSPPALVGAALAMGALALTLDELVRAQPVYFSWPNKPAVGALLLLALIAAMGWLIRDTRHRVAANAWAKAALALALSLPLGWIFTAGIVFRKFSGIPDGDMPDGVIDRMNADVFQMQIAALLVMSGVLVCIVMTTRPTRDITPPASPAATPPPPPGYSPAPPA